MCGRFNLKSNLSLIAEYFAVVRGYMEPWSPRYNIAPTQNVLCVRDSDQREFFYPKWGLIPSWSKDAKIASACINARAEMGCSLRSVRPAFSVSFASSGSGGSPARR